MLRKIDTRQLQPGMFLHELCGNWINHPFWRTSFKLKDAAQIAKIVDSGITEAMIDTDKGLDVAVATAPPPAPAAPVRSARDSTVPRRVGTCQCMHAGLCATDSEHTRPVLGGGPSPVVQRARPGKVFRSLPSP